MTKAEKKKLAYDVIMVHLSYIPESHLYFKYLQNFDTAEEGNKYLIDLIDKIKETISNEE